MQVIHKLKMDLLRQNNTQIIDAVQWQSGLENGKHYYQAGEIYRCFRDSVNHVYQPLADLIGHYVEVATV